MLIFSPIMEKSYNGDHGKRFYEFKGWYYAVDSGGEKYGSKEVVMSSLCSPSSYVWNLARTEQNKAWREVGSSKCLKEDDIKEY